MDFNYDISIEQMKINGAVRSEEERERERETKETKSERVRHAACPEDTLLPRVLDGFEALKSLLSAAS